MGIPIFEDACYAAEDALSIEKYGETGRLSPQEKQQLRVALSAYESERLSATSPKAPESGT